MTTPSGSAGASAAEAGSTADATTSATASTLAAPASASTSAVVEPSVPLLRVVKGDPTPEELAALIAVVAARSGGDAEAAAEPTSAWRDRSRYVRRPLTPGPNAWRASVLPS